MCPSVGFIQFSCQEKFGRYKYSYFDVVYSGILNVNGVYKASFRTFSTLYKLQSFEYVNICFVDECPAKSIEIIGLESKV